MEGRSLSVRWRHLPKRGRLLRLLFPQPEPPFHRACLRGNALKPRRLANLFPPFLFVRKGGAPPRHERQGGTCGNPPTEGLFGRIQPENPLKPLARDVFDTYTPNDIGTKMTKNTGLFPGRTPHDSGTKMTKTAPQSRFPGQPAKNKRNPPKKAPRFCAFFYLVPLAL